MEETQNHGNNPVSQTTQPPPLNPTAALVVEGGAMRGIFTTGMLDRFLEARFNPFDLLIGVSSGATNLAAYLAQMPQRNFKIYTDYCLRPQFLDLRRFIFGGHLMDLDWLWQQTIAEIRLDIDTLFSHNKRFLIVVTDVLTGRAVYHEPRAQSVEEDLKASSAMPVIYRAFPQVAGRPSVDGGIADPLPVEKAMEMNARKIMIIRSRPSNYVKKEAIANRYLLWRLKPYPDLRKTVAGRVQRYNTAVTLIRKPPPDTSIIEICPPDNFNLGRFGRNKADLIRWYHQGQRIADQAMQRWDKKNKIQGLSEQ